MCARVCVCVCVSVCVCVCCVVCVCVCVSVCVVHLCGGRLYIQSDTVSQLHTLMYCIIYCMIVVLTLSHGVYNNCTHK